MGSDNPEFYSPAPIELAHRTVHVWRVDLDSAGYFLDNLTAVLDDAERQRASRFMNDEAKHRYLICRGLLRLFLSAYLGVSPRNIEFAVSSHGKPRLADAKDDAGLVFNLSHSGRHAVFAFGRDTRLGIDVEAWREIANPEGIIERCFAKQEKQYWYQLEPEQREAAFYVFWTRKESFVKAVGKGISLGLDQCVSSLESDAGFSALPVACGKVGDWTLRDLNMGSGVSAAVSVNVRSCRIIERETPVGMLLGRNLDEL